MAPWYDTTPSRYILHHRCPVMLTCKVARPRTETYWDYTPLTALVWHSAQYLHLTQPWYCQSEVQGDFLTWMEQEWGYSPLITWV